MRDFAAFVATTFGLPPIRIEVRAIEGEVSIGVAKTDRNAAAANLGRPIAINQKISRARTRFWKVR